MGSSSWTTQLQQLRRGRHGRAGGWRGRRDPAREAETVSVNVMAIREIKDRERERERHKHSPGRCYVPATSQGLVTAFIDRVRRRLEEGDRGGGVG